MRITLTLPNGSTQRLDVATLSVEIGDALVELSHEQDPLQLKLHTAATGAVWHRFAIHPGAANMVRVELIRETPRAAPESSEL